MSTASALLSMIAPAAPTTSQGSAAVDASAFEGLLASMLGDGADEGLRETPLQSEHDDPTVSAQTGVAVLPSQPLLQIHAAGLSAVASEPAAGQIDDDTALPAAPPLPVAAQDAAPAVEPVSPGPVMEAPEIDASATDASAIALSLPVPVMPAPVTDAPPASAPTAVRPGASEAPPVVDPVAPAPAIANPDPAAPAKAAGDVTAEAPSATTPLPVDKAPTTKTAADPQVRPAVKTDQTGAPEVLPPAPIEPDVKTATAQPLTLPPAPPVSAGPTPVVVTPARRLVGDMDGARLDDGAMVEVARPQGEALTRTASTTPTSEPSQPAPAVVGKATGEPLAQSTAPASASASAQDEVVAPAQTPKPSGAPDVADTARSSAPDAERKSAETLRPVESPVLRPQTGRASRSVETNSAVDAAAPSTPMTAPPQASGATAPNPSAGPAPVSASARTIEASVTEAAEDDTASADIPVDAAGPEAAPSAQTAHDVREAQGPTMSRAAIEATAQIAAQILRKLDGRSTRFEMSLTPDELGRVDIKLDIDAEGRLAARLAFDNPAAAADLRGRVDDLRRQLEQQGFHLADDAFEFTQRDNGSSAFDRGQDSRQSQDRDQSRAFAAASRLHADADVVAQPSRWTALSLTPAGVDMKV